MKKLSKKARMSGKRSYTVASGPVSVLVAQLTDIDFYPRMSEETLAFNATLHLQAGADIFSYECSNDGHGGCTSIHPQIVRTCAETDGRSREVLNQWQAFLSSQRDNEFYEVSDQLGWTLAGNGPMVAKTVESEVNSMLAEWCDKHNL